MPVGKGVVFVGALTVNPSNLSDTASALFVRDLAELRRRAPHPAADDDADAGWRPVANAPRLDEDGMPKDRMALLVPPADDDTLFVAGNAGALAWRVAWRSGTWTEAYGKDTADGSAPHGDCRNYYWEPTTGSLILLNDGGAHMRTMPMDAGRGVWKSLSGDTGAMELVSAVYHTPSRTWVGGAQDNCVQLATNATAATRAIGFVEGDGTVTAIDPTTKPPRFYGATQFLGNLADGDAHPHRRSRRSRRLEKQRAARVVDDDDDDHVGFGYATVDASGKVEVTGMDVLRWFDIDQFPFFDHPYALNVSSPRAKTGEGLPVVVWARKGKSGPSGFYIVHPTDKRRREGNGRTAAAAASPPPQLVLPTDGDVYAFVVGKTAGRPDPSALVAMNGTHLLRRSGASGGALTAHPLPTAFAAPIEFAFVNPSTYILGPVSHDRTVSPSPPTTRRRWR